MKYRKVFEVPSDLPEAKSFSELGVKFDDEEKPSVDFGDNGKQSEEATDQLQADSLLLDVLFKLNDRQKIVLLYQIVRELGYGLNYTEYSKTLSITRQKYLIILKGVKAKAGKALGYSENSSEEAE